MPALRFKNHSSHLGVQIPMFRPLSSNLPAVGHQDDSAGVAVESTNDREDRQTLFNILTIVYITCSYAVKTHKERYLFVGQAVVKEGHLFTFHFNNHREWVL